MLTRKDLIAHIANRADITKKFAEEVLDATLDSIRAELELDGGCVHLCRFGKFTSTLQPAYKGRNPLTGAAVDVPAKVRIRFRASKKGEE